MPDQSPAEQKVPLRKKFIEQRKELHSDYVVDRSQELVKLLVEQIEWSKIKKIHCFLPIIQDNEPDLREFIKYALDKCDVYATYPPFSEVEELDSYIIRQYDLSQKIKFDVIIVPMIAYDPITKHRLGYGGGFYDRILAAQPQTLKIGVCLQGFEAKLPIEPHDIPLDKIITA